MHQNDENVVCDSISGNLSPIFHQCSEGIMNKLSGCTYALGVCNFTGMALRSHSTPFVIIFYKKSKYFDYILKIRKSLIFSIGFMIEKKCIYRKKKKISVQTKV